MDGHGRSAQRDPPLEAGQAEASALGKRLMEFTYNYSAVALSIGSFTGLVMTTGIRRVSSSARGHFHRHCHHRVRHRPMVRLPATQRARHSDWVGCARSGDFVDALFGYGGDAFRCGAVTDRVARAAALGALSCPGSRHSHLRDLQPLPRGFFGADLAEPTARLTPLARSAAKRTGQPRRLILPGHRSRVNRHDTTGAELRMWGDGLWLRLSV